MMYSSNQLKTCYIYTQSRSLDTRTNKELVVFQHFGTSKWFRMFLHTSTELQLTVEINQKEMSLFSRDRFIFNSDLIFFLLKTCSLFEIEYMYILQRIHLSLLSGLSNGVTFLSEPSAHTDALAWVWPYLRFRSVRPYLLSEVFDRTFVLEVFEVSVILSSL